MPTAIIGTGRALPKRMVQNAELEAEFGMPAGEIARKTGIETRYWAGPGETAATLAVNAAGAALESAALPPHAIDLILIATTTPDMYFPSTACLVQRGLGARAAPAFDINASCSGFLYALSIADRYLRSGTASTALVAATDLKSRFTNPADPATAILFGDGAGAVILRRGDRGIGPIGIGADGTRHRLIHLPGGGSRRPVTAASLEADLHTMRMDGKRLFRAAVNQTAATLSAFLSTVSVPLDRIDRFIFHQANLRILNALFKRMGIVSARAEITLTRFGNTSSASIPMALDAAAREGRLKRGDRLLLSAFGGGMTWGNILIDW